MKNENKKRFLTFIVQQLWTPKKFVLRMASALLKILQLSQLMAVDYKCYGTLGMGRGREDYLSVPSDAFRIAEYTRM